MKPLDGRPRYFMHMPLLLGKDGKKLSKRNNPTSIFYFRDSGYLPEAFINFLTLMGYSMPDDKEIYTLDELFENLIRNGLAYLGRLFRYPEIGLDQSAIPDQFDSNRSALGKNQAVGFQ